MRTQRTIAASLIVAVVLSAGIPAFDVVAAGQRGDDGETTRYSVDSENPFRVLGGAKAAPHAGRVR